MYLLFLAFIIMYVIQISHFRWPLKHLQQAAAEGVVEARLLETRNLNVNFDVHLPLLQSTRHQTPSLNKFKISI